MKLHFLFLGLVFLSIGSSHSQVRTGGAGGDAEGSIGDANNIIKSFEKHLVVRDSVCSPNNRLLKNPDLMQSYLKLSLFKKPKSITDSCSEANRYFVCFVDLATQVNVERLKNNKFVITLLVEKYKITPEEAGGMIKFFEELDSKPK